MEPTRSRLPTPSPPSPSPSTFVPTVSFPIPLFSPPLPPPLLAPESRSFASRVLLVGATSGSFSQVRPGIYTPLRIPRTCPESYGGAIRFRIYPASRVARYQVYLLVSVRGRTREEILSFSKYTSSILPDTPSFQRDSKKVKGGICPGTCSEFCNRYVRTILKCCSCYFRRTFERVLSCTR